MSFYHYQPIPFAQVRVRDSFWSARQRVNHERSLPKQYAMCVRTGRFDALKLDWTPDCGKPKPHIYWDSDTAKWLEAACYACQIRPDADLRAKIDAIAALFARAQQPDGYLNSYFTTVDKRGRWKNLRENHELYCAGHIIEACVAHHALTGEHLLLDTARRLADCVDRTFGTGAGKIRGYCGHEEIELALVRLYAATRERRYLDLAAYFINERGQSPLYFEAEARARGDTSKYSPEKLQAHKPVREQRDAEGHAVRAMYLYSGMTDVAALTQDGELLAACDAIWESLERRKAYVTGGCGSSWFDEKFTGDFDLPNERAYCETCASVALVMWARRMSMRSADARYAELMERALYNGAIAGMSLDGEKFFYQNPLASYGEHRRKDWFDCSCCPSNLSRLLGSLGGYIALCAKDAIALNLYIGAEIDFDLENGARGTLRIDGEMPFEGRVALSLSLAQAAETPWALRLRVPAWSRNFRVAVNGQAQTLPVKDGRVEITRLWRDGDAVQIAFDMPILQLAADARVLSDNGQIALQRGPFVYCAEGVDFSEANAVYRLAFDNKTVETLAPVRVPDLLDDVVVLRGQALLEPERGVSSGLYFPIDAPFGKFKTTAFQAIPYYAWENRAACAMRIWIPRFF